MSVESMALVLHHSAASGTEKVVLLGIANHAGDGGAWPAIETLARYANISTRGVQRAIRALEAAGELRVDQRAGGDRDTPHWARTNRYEVLVQCPPDCDGTSRHRTRTAPVENTHSAAPDPLTPVSPPDASVTGSDVSPGDTSVTSPLTPTSPEPSFNQDPPLPPASGGSPPVDDPTAPRAAGPACPRHPAGDGTNCRGCGTTARQADQQQRRARAQSDRAAAAAAAAHARAARAAAAPPPRGLLDQTRQAIQARGASR